METSTLVQVYSVYPNPTRIWVSDLKNNLLCVSERPFYGVLLCPCLSVPLPEHFFLRLWPHPDGVRLSPVQGDPRRSSILLCVFPRGSRKTPSRPTTGVELKPGDRRTWYSLMYRQEPRSVTYHENDVVTILWSRGWLWTIVVCIVCALDWETEEVFLEVVYERSRATSTVEESEVIVNGQKLSDDSVTVHKLLIKNGIVERR